MLRRFANIVAIFLFILFFLQPLLANDTETEIKQLEAKLIYESASELAKDEEYDKSIIRLDRIISEYPETEYARLAVTKKSEVIKLKLYPKPVSGISKASLIGFGTLFTTWLGLGTMIIIDTDEPTFYGLALIASPVAGLMISSDITRKLKVSNAQASLIRLGGAWGVWQATATAIVTDVDYKIGIGASMIGGLMGLGISTLIVKERYISPGQATMINFGGIWGTFFALCGAGIAGTDDGDYALTSAILGGDVGIITMSALSPKLKMSQARARLINLCGIVGTLYGIGTNILIEVDSERAFWSVMTLGSILGLTAGTYFTRNFDVEKGYFAEETAGFTSISPYFANNSLKQSTGARFRIPIVSFKF